MASQPDSSANRETYQAAFLTLRLLDEWIATGEMLADPGFLAHASTREAIGRLAHDTETQTALTRIVDAMTALQAPDAQPVLPRVFAYGAMLEHRGEPEVAADVFATVTRYVDARSEFDLAFDALMREGFCRRLMGDLDAAERAYENAGIIAGRSRDRSRVLLARVGEAKVAWARGNLPEADEALAGIAGEAAGLGDSRVRSIALHDRAGVARMRNDLPRAISHVADSLRHAADAGDRERVLADLGNFLGLAGAFGTARQALSLLERIASRQEIRWIAQHNLMDLAVREGSETVFEQYRRRLSESALPTRNAIYFLRDAGAGLAVFGRTAEAQQALTQGLELAHKAGMHQVAFEVQAALEALEAQQGETTPRAPTEHAAPTSLTDEIEQLLQDVAATV